MKNFHGWMVLFSMCSIASTAVFAADGDLPGGMHSTEAVTTAITNTLGGKSAPACLHNKAPIGGSFESGRGFYAESKCEVRCRGSEASRTVTRDAPFNPKSLGLHNGDGEVAYATLTSHMQAFASRTCIEAAAIACGGIDKIDDASFQGMSSGKWSMPPKLTCDSAQPRILSPFDSVFGGAGLRTSPLDPGLANEVSPIPRLSSIGKFVPMPRRPDEKKQRFERFSPPPTREKLLKEGYEPGEIDEVMAKIASSHVDAASCKTQILAQTCYGRCICYTTGAESEPACPHNNSLALASPAENAYSEFSVCADSLIDELRAKGLAGTSKAVLRHYCEDFAVRTITSDQYAYGVAENTGKSCAAYRGSFDCESVIAAAASK